MDRVATPGVDSVQRRHITVFQFDIADCTARTCRALLRELHRSWLPVAETALCRGRHGASGASVVAGFSARFFKGPLDEVRDVRSRASRFQIAAPPPRCLYAMNVRGDDRSKTLATGAAIAAAESDVVLLFEADELGPEEGLHELLVGALRSNRIARLRLQRGFLPADGRNALGYRDGISNLEDIRAAEPDRYRSYVFASGECSEHRPYHGGTYVVFRKYALNLARWQSLGAGGLQSSDGSRARDLAIGRDIDGRVISRVSGTPLEPRHDCSEAADAFNCSHIRKANPRGRGLTTFGAPVRIRDARILRRSFSCDEGLLFLCFQADIQRRGFEFINNEWLMSRFMGGVDPLLSPEHGVVMPLSGCYYFCPPAEAFPGDVFFRETRSWARRSG